MSALVIRLQVQPTLFATAADPETAVTAWQEQVIAWMRQATDHAATAGLQLAWNPLRTRRVTQIYTLAPDAWLWRWSRAFRWCQEQRSHLPDTMDAYFADGLVAAPYRGYAPGDVGWWAANLAGVTAVLC